jgi:hypothetical protein
VIDGYRNKCEFSCGKGNNNEDKVVGFRYGEYRFGVDRVGSPSVCKNVSDEMKLVVQVSKINFISKTKTLSYSIFKIISDLVHLLGIPLKLILVVGDN